MTFSIQQVIIGPYQDFSKYLQQKMTWDLYLQRHLEWSSFRSPKEVAYYLPPSKRTPIHAPDIHDKFALYMLRKYALSTSFLLSIMELHCLLPSSYYTRYNRQYAHDHETVSLRVIRNFEDIKEDFDTEALILFWLKIYLPRLSVCKQEDGYILKLPKRPQCTVKSFLLRRRRKIFRKRCMRRIHDLLWKPPLGLLVQKAWKDSQECYSTVDAATAS